MRHADLTNISEDSMDKPVSHFHSPSTEGRSSSLIKQIYDAENPVAFTRGIPAQRLFLAVKERGLESSIEILEMASREQFQLMLDFDLWSYDSFEESQIWSWLELTDSTEDLTILQKVLHSLDPKLIALLISRYLEVIVMEEATEQPPADGFHTPDKGATWMRSTIEDEHQDFLFKRLLAMIFETSAELFYQLINIPSVSTQTVIEEESYQEKNKRLLAEGFPDDEWAAELNAPLPIVKAIQKIQHKEIVGSVGDLHSVPAFSHSHSIPQPLKGFLQEVGQTEETQQEMTLICNSALIHFRIPTWEQEQVSTTLEQVRGALNIGLTALKSMTEASSQDLIESLGMRGIYQVGLSRLYTLRNRARRVSEEQCRGEPTLLTLLEGLQQRIPMLPAFIDESGLAHEVDGKLESGFRPIETVGDVEVAEHLISQLEAHGSVETS